MPSAKSNSFTAGRGFRQERALTGHPIPADQDPERWRAAEAAGARAGVQRGAVTQARLLDAVLQAPSGISDEAAQAWRGVKVQPQMYGYGDGPSLGGAMPSLGDALEAKFDKQNQQESQRRNAEERQLYQDDLDGISAQHQRRNNVFASSSRSTPTPSEPPRSTR